MTVSILTGDCRVVLKTLPASSVHSCVTDPPYHLTSIVKRFGASNAAPAKVKETGVYARSSAGFMGQTWDGGDVAFRPETWAEVLRVLKPGGWLLAFSGSRTYHRMVCAIEDAGFEVRDQIMWLYGSGFPKSHDVSKGIDRAAGAEREVVGLKAGHGSTSTLSRQKQSDYGYRPNGEPYGEYDGTGLAPVTAPATDAARQWEGWGTALKPAHEPIVMARKPLGEKTVAANVLKWGCGALNIDACRVGASSQPPSPVHDVYRDSPEGSRPCTCLSPTDDHTSRMTGTRNPISSASLHHLQNDRPANGELSGLDDQQFQGSQGDYHPSDGSCDEHTRQSEVYDQAPAEQVDGARKSPALDGGRQHNRVDPSSSCPIHTTQHIQQQGRWPANVIHDGSDEVLAGFPETKSGSIALHHKRTTSKTSNTFGERAAPPEQTFGDSGSAARFFKSCSWSEDECLPQENHDQPASAESQSGLCETPIAPAVAAIRNSDSKSEELPVIPASIGSSSECSPTRSRVSPVAIPDNTDIIETTVSRLRSCGSAPLAIGENIKPESLALNTSPDARRFIYCPKASKADRDEGLTSPEQPIVTFATANGTSGKPSSISEGRNTAYRNNHPTVKPTDLMRYLCRLVTPPGGTVLDPFMGSGSTLKAARIEQFSFIGIDLDPAYTELARARADADAPLFAEAVA